MTQRITLLALLVYLLGANSDIAHGQILRDLIERESVGGAIPTGLKWLSSRKNEDGSWTFQPEGDEPAPMNASATQVTGMALLAYLGAGQNHKHGTYKEPVHDGLSFLIRKMKVTEERGDLRGGGDMTAHGVATFALCEAYQQTLDRELKNAAELAIAFIQHTQNESGGWGNWPMGPDDMHVFGWQLLALHSASIADLPVADATTKKMMNYLDGQTASGRYYGRYERGRDAQATAIGLLGRVMLGWDENDILVNEGTDWLADPGPTRHALERNFFTHQIVFHRQGKSWSHWNGKIRDQIISRQDKEEEHRGSWHDADDECGKSLGRVSQTAINLMMLEVYNRHLGVYRATGQR